MKIILKNKLQNEFYSIYDIAEDMDISVLKDSIIKKWKLKKLNPFDILILFEGKKLNNLDHIPKNTTETNFLSVEYKDPNKYCIEEEDSIVNIRIREIIIFTKERIVNIITPDGGKGTGIIISKKGHILTAKHCWTSEDKNGLPLFYPQSHDQRKIIYKGNEKRCKYVWHSNLHDYMICKIRNEKGEEYPFMEIDDSGAYPGEKIYLIGFAEMDSSEPVITHGIISHMDRGFKQPFVYFSTDVESLNGQSGGPIVTINNKCRGIHIGRNPNHSQYTTCYIPCFVFTGELLAIEGLYESIFHV